MSLGRMYTIVFEQVAVSAAQDFVEINAPADAPVVVHAVHLTQSSDSGDTESEQIPVLIHRGSTSGSGGSAVTPNPLHEGDPAFGGTCERNNTSQGTEGTIIHAESFNVMAGLQLIWTPECRPVISPSDRLIIELQVSPADALTVDGTIYIEEVGG